MVNMKERGLSIFLALSIAAGCSSGEIASKARSRNGGSDGTPGQGSDGQSGTDGQTGSNGGTPGSTQTNSGEAPGSVGPPPTTLPVPTTCTSSATAAPGPRVLRRLTSAQFNASLRDLFRDASVPQATFFNDASTLGFKIDASQLVIQDLMAQQLMDFADQVATWVDTHPASVASCMTTDSNCRRSFISSFGKRAFRAPLTAAQTATYEALFSSQTTFTEATHVVVQAMLQSPYFLYRPELGTKDPSGTDRFVLSPYEVAASLSYFLTDSLPDDALLAAADSGQLATPAQIDGHVERLLRDSRGQTAIGNFMTGWLGFDNVLTTVKKDELSSVLTNDLRKSMYAESLSLLLDTFTRKGTFADALTARHSFLDSGLASFYGVPGVNGSQPTRVTLPTGQRDVGLLAHASILSGNASAEASSPVKRGKLIRTRLLCETLPPPPPGLATELAKPSGPQTTRARYEAHSKNAPCSGCHRYMDPIGFAFEHYDAIGRYRDNESGFPVDSSGSIISKKQLPDVPLTGVADLSQYLASSEDVKSCMVRYWSYFAYGVSSWKEDGCTQDAIKKEASASGYTMESVVRAIAHSPHFLARTKDL
jgi:hypothetical protein